MSLGLTKTARSVLLEHLDATRRVANSSSRLDSTSRRIGDLLGAAQNNAQRLKDITEAEDEIWLGSTGLESNLIASHVARLEKLFAEIWNTLKEMRTLFADIRSEVDDLIAHSSASLDETFSIFPSPYVFRERLEDTKRLYGDRLAHQEAVLADLTSYESLDAVVNLWKNSEASFSSLKRWFLVAESVHELVVTM
ncbi:hypothetical protein NDN08_002345 [Rhodosorus marinus]|uniref:Uncharacterized protein n=1 Tax=Rhodosorus marinus TaxID=101924 RepID=A0AAV8UTG3_9RHOD|nr:hypothetical protein NDN08_002345 [Rhodosorus marinus]